MSGKMVLIIQSGRFLGEIISSLFDDNETLSIIEAAPASVRELLHEVVTRRPDCVLLDDTVQERYLNALLRHMQTARGLRVVVVNTNANRLEVYEKQQVEVHQKADFFAVL